MKAVQSWLILLLCVLLSPHSPQAANRFVGLGGDNSRDGSTQNKRWETLAFAFGNLNPGDTLNVLPGDYVLRDSPGHVAGRIDISRLGGAPIEGNPNAITTIRATEQGTVNITGNLVFQGAYIRLEGLNVVGDSQNDEPGILAFNTHHVDVFRCEVSYCGGGGINFAHSDSIRVFGNWVHHNGFRNPGQQSGISIYQPIRVADPENRYWNVQVQNNISYSNRNDVVGDEGITDGNGIILDDSQYTQRQWLTDDQLERIGNDARYPGRILIEGNDCTYNGGSGIQIYRSAKATVKNNTCVGNRRFAFTLDWQYINHGQISLLRANNCHVLNNVCQSTPVTHAFGYGGAPYVASDSEGGDNLWQANLLHTWVLGSLLSDNPDAIEAQSFQVPPRFANAQAYDYRSVAGIGLGIPWSGHSYADLKGTVVGSGERNDLGAIQSGNR